LARCWCLLCYLIQWLHLFSCQTRYTICQSSTCPRPGRAIWLHLSMTIWMSFCRFLPPFLLH
jgi:hypothetical protein